jgi:predicted permease
MLNKLRTWLRAQLRRSEMERELDEELRQHIERQTVQNIRLGMSPEEARHAALKGFGGVELTKERSRDARGGRWIEELWQDLRYGVRMLVKNPGFTLVAVLTLALGIGANTAIFSVINAALLRPLPYAQPDRIVAIWDGRGQPSSTQGTTLPRNFQLWREQIRSFSDLALARPLTYRLTEMQEAITGLGQEVTPNLFTLLGVSALHGRPLAPGDETAGDRVVVLGYKIWRTSFGGDEGIVGRTIKLNDGSYTVLGIMPPQFVFPPRVSVATEGATQDCDLWVPMAIDQRRLQTSGRSYFAFGRLRPDVTLAQAQSDMNAFAQRSMETHPAQNEQLSIHLAQLSELTAREARPALSALLGVVALILLIACANVANLLLARATARSREIAIRTALGATRQRVLMQILTECALLGLLGGMIGLAFAYGGLRLLSSVAVLQSPNPVEINLTVLGFTLLISLVTSLLYGMAAAWHMARWTISESFRSAHMRSAFAWH